MFEKGYEANWSEEVYDDIYNSWTSSTNTSSLQNQRWKVSYIRGIILWELQKVRTLVYFEYHKFYDTVQETEEEKHLLVLLDNDLVWEEVLEEIWVFMSVYPAMHQQTCLKKTNQLCLQRNCDPQLFWMAPMRWLWLTLFFHITGNFVTKGGIVFKLEIVKFIWQNRK